ncbi:MAG: putative Ig domain-containing protein [Bacteroidota bacterium]
MQTKFYHWIKIQRRYRNTQRRYALTGEKRLALKLGHLSRRIHRLNRSWKIGVTSAALAAWMAAAPPTALKAQDFPATLELSTLNGTNGFLINGISAFDRTGNVVSNAGDINGDGIDDIIVGANGADPDSKDYAGRSYIVFGKTTPSMTSLDLENLDGTNGFVINGIDERDYSGTSVSDAGDVNGDGIDDLIIGARDADPNGVNRAGETYVVFGKTTPFAASLELSSLDGTNGFVINGINEGDYSGISASGAGDINGDGQYDIIIGARGADPNDNMRSGEAYVVFGKADGFGASLDLSSLDGTNGFVINGTDERDFLGYAVSNAGDINGDGVDDVLIGAPDADPNGQTDAGEIYVVFGKTDGFAASLDLSDLDGTNGFVINGANEYGYASNALSSAGDINGDGADDILIGAPYTGSNYEGEVYVVFGKTTAFSASLNLSDLDGTNGFIISGIDEDGYLGRSVSGAGDINGDGLDDFLVGAPYAGDDGPGSDGSGQTYVVFGKATAFVDSLDLSGLDGTNGFTINGIDNTDYAGGAVSSAGDINGDGVDDILIGAPYNTGIVGEMYVVFGIQASVPPTVANPIPDQTIIVGEAFSFEVPANTFEDRNADDTQTLSASLLGGDPLPLWLMFGAGNGSFSGTPANEDVGTISIEVTATDGEGQSVADVFELEVIASTVVGLDRLEESDITVYPNPVSNLLVIESAESMQVEIMDLSGKVHKLTTSDQPVVVGALPNGVYLIRLTDASGEITMGRFIKK